MGCTTCGGSGVYSPDVVLTTPRIQMPGGLVLVEWQGDVPFSMQTSERQYAFTAERRQLYMTSADYAAAAAHIDGLVIVEPAGPMGSQELATP